MRGPLPDPGLSGPRVAEPRRPTLPATPTPPPRDEQNFTPGSRRCGRDQRLLALVLAHTPAHTDETTLHTIGALRSVTACGTDTDEADGLRLWALLETQPPKTTTRSA
ncbi:hypothetical protein ACWGHM_40790 [Streptomyces sp. NPDC054904]